MTRIEHTAGQREQVSGVPGEMGTLPSQDQPKTDTETTTACSAGGVKQGWYLQPGKNLLKASALRAVSGVLARGLIQPEPPTVASDGRC